MNMKDLGIIIVGLIVLIIIGYLNYKSIIIRSKSLIELVKDYQKTGKK